MPNHIRSILQVRLDSSRLPAKALLWTPIGPLFVASALRAMRSGIETVVATTADDDGRLLNAVAKQWNIPVFLGAKEDVLLRFIQATNDLEDDAIIVRLTGDNIVPDSLLVEDCVSCFVEAGVDYVTTNSKVTPYGLSVEVFRRSTLLRAHMKTSSSAEREHVTLGIIRSDEFSKKALERGACDQSDDPLRITIDTLDDYRCWLPVFTSGKDLLSADWNDMLSKYKGSIHRER